MSKFDQPQRGTQSTNVLAASLCFLCFFVTSVATAQTTKLDQGWQLLVDPTANLKTDTIGKSQEWRKVLVGLSWNAQFPDLRDYMGVAWYRTQLQRPAVSNGQRIFLEFGAVDYFSEVFVNGTRVGEHEGGYTPFKFDITDAMKAGANELLVRVIDPPMDEKDNRARFPELMYNEIPHGKQNWYVQTGGIWQPVTMRVCPRNCIEQVEVTTRVDGQMLISVTRTNRGRIPQAVPTQMILRNPRGRVVARASKPEVSDLVAFEGRVESPQLWSPDRPNLYTVEVRSGADTATASFGFRSFEARDGKFYLNGQPFYMIAALDQDFYPDTIYTPPSLAYVRDEMIKAKRLGLNLLRCHIKVCDPTYLRAADEVGMLVWYEIPSWNDFNHFTKKAGERGEKIFHEMVERDWNHPSIVIQSIINEGWGADLAQQAESRRWLRAAFDRAKTATAPLGRLIVDNSACCNNFHLKTDIEDNHRYNSIPDDYRAFDQWVADFAARPKWNFSPHGDAEPTGREPLVVSEFGNWGLPLLPKNLPWWFARAFGDRQVTRPAGLFDRFKEFRLGTVFPNYDALAVATQWHQFLSLKHEIEEIRRYPSIQGYVITEFTDINWEANGLLSMWRQPKAYAAELAKLQQPDVVMARTNKKNFSSGESIQLEVLLSHYSRRDLHGAKIIWRNEAGKQLAAQSLSGAIAPGGVTSIVKRTQRAPDVTAPQRQSTRIQLLDQAGTLIAENSVTIFVYPRPRPAVQVALKFAGTESGLKPEQMAAAGYRILGESDAAPRALVIAHKLDEEVEQYVRDGGRALVLADAKDALPKGPLKVTPRAGSDLDGNWVTNFNWARTDSLSSPFRAVGFTKILGFESEHVVPRFVIQGIEGANYDDVLSGIFYGWLNNNAALAAQMRVGRGALLVTTFRFNEYGKDPYATHLLDSLIRYVTAPNFQPRLAVDLKRALQHDQD
jgi:Glycosyl hydrolases family 2, sugar binding domain/Glycosyl hydrolases family 2